MGSPRKPHRHNAWFSKQATALMFDVTEAYFDRQIRPLVSPQHVDKIGGRLIFYGRGVIDAFVRSKLSPATVTDVSDEQFDRNLAAAQMLVQSIDNFI